MAKKKKRPKVKAAAGNVRAATSRAKPAKKQAASSRTKPSKKKQKHISTLRDGSAAEAGASAAEIAAQTKRLAFSIRQEGRSISSTAARTGDGIPIERPTTPHHQHHQPDDDPQKFEESVLHEGPAFTICGIGASAGGLEAMTLLLKALPANPGVAIILIVHLSPQHESVLPALLSVTSALPVDHAKDGVLVEPDHVYVVPPNVQMDITEGRLRLTPRPADRSQYLPVDHFFRSLAEFAQDRALAIVLSGNGSDGSAGIRDIKAVGGIALAQDPRTADSDDMPRNAIATGEVDLILTPEKIAAEMVRIARHPAPAIGPMAMDLATMTARRKGPDRDPSPYGGPGDGDGSATDDVTADASLMRIFMILRKGTGVDFSQYKQPTIRRRLQRRMVLHKLKTVGEYLVLLQKDPDEVTRLYQDVLIHVTRFFREPESYQTLVDFVFPHQFEHRAGDEPIRIWVPGCATGEEPYSIAMVLMEFLGDRAGQVPVQIFATDVSEHAIERARAGVYPHNIAADVSPERLRRFFTKVDGSYRINKHVRDMCIFARQDLTRDPPFSKLDLIVCRNVLIYLGAVMQKKLMGVFHYALKPHGYLMLGAAETVGTAADLFTGVDKKHRLYSKKAAVHRSDLRFTPAGYDYQRLDRQQHQNQQHAFGPAAPGGTATSEANRLILERYAPAGVLVDKDLRIVHFRGQTGRYLESAPGGASHNLLKMAREGLLHGLQTAVGEARRTHESVRRNGLRVKHTGSITTVDIEVIPLSTSEGPFLLIMFHEALPAAKADGKDRSRGRKEKPAKAGRAGAAVADADQDARIHQLQQELAASREYLQSIIQDLEAANEELQSANEEILSSNEELQSTNEELDTAKEELQSTNEELNTVNEELHGRNDELSLVNSDLVNLLGSVQIAIVMVAGDLRIRRFTPMAEKVLNLIPGDLGRPISDIKPNIECPDLETLIKDAVDSVSAVEREVRDRQGNAMLLRIRPYKNVENKIDGAILALFDVDGSRRQEQRSREALRFAEAIGQGIRQPLMVLDADQQVLLINRPFSQMFGISTGDADGVSLSDFAGGAWNLPPLQTALSSLPRDGTPVRLELHRPAGSDGSGGNGALMEVDVWRLPGPDERGLTILMIIEQS